LKKVRALLLTGAISLGSLVVASPAQASCQTNPDVGDICKAIEVIDNAVCRTKPGQYLPRCQG
jgi:hypothetical protein